MYMKRLVFLRPRWGMSQQCGSTRSNSSAKAKEPQELVLVSRKNGVSTLTMNNPSKLNAWTFDMMRCLFSAMESAAKDPEVKAAIITGTDPYDCAGVNLNAMIKPMHPKKLHELIRSSNKVKIKTKICYTYTWKYGLEPSHPTSILALRPAKACWARGCVNH